MPISCALAAHVGSSVIGTRGAGHSVAQESAHTTSAEEQMSQRAHSSEEPKSSQSEGVHQDSHPVSVAGAVGGAVGEGGKTQSILDSPGPPGAQPSVSALGLKFN